MNIKKIGLTALAGSLVATSVFAGEMTVSGSAAINWEGQDKTTQGNTFRMADSITFSGGGELDNGFTIAASFELDQGASDTKAGQSGGAAAGSAGPFDSHSITLGMGDLGTLTFAGHGGSSAMGAVDDVMPAYEEPFDILNTSTTAGSGGDVQTAVAGTGAIGSAGDDNMFTYNNSSLVDGVSVTLSYLPSDATYTESSTDFAIAYTGVEGLTVGYAQGENGLSGTSAIDSETMYIKYVYGPVTVGYQESEQDTDGTTNDNEYTSMGVSYAVNDSLSISYGVSEYDDKNSTTDQENTAIGFSYTMGSMTLAGAHAKVENQGASSAAVNDITGYELNLSFAF
jgi:outer membrane protein OmpU